MSKKYEVTMQVTFVVEAENEEEAVLFACSDFFVQDVDGANIIEIEEAE